MIRTGRQMLLFSLLLFSLLSCQSVAEAPQSTVPEHSATVATSRGERWEARHTRQVGEAEELGVELLFLGDSITNRWSVEGAEAWEEFYGDRKAYNLGNGGDRTEHTLWRLEHGKIDRLQPRLLVLMIGTNNLVQKEEAMPNTPREIADGVTAVVHGLKRRMPDTHILVVATFPRGKGPRHRFRQKTAEISPMLAELADGGRVHFLDIGNVFIGEDGRIPEDVMPDGLHLSPKGYRLWAESIEEKVSELLKDPR